MANRYRLEVDGKQVAEWEGHRLRETLPVAAHGYGICMLDYREVDQLGTVRWMEPGRGVMVCLSRVAGE